MRRRIALDTGWRLKGYAGEDWALEASRQDWQGEGWIAASVPGSVAHDVVLAGGTPDPYVERGSLALEWVSARAWRYTSTVTLPELGPGERAALRFDGVDHAATVLWDGNALGRHEGMFTAFEVPLPGSGGAHRLDVVVAPAPPSEPQVGRTSRVRIHKSRMSYGWDFCPRLVHQGVWRPVTLEIGGPGAIAAVRARPELRADLAHAVVPVEVDLAGAEDGEQEVVVRVELADGDRVVATGERAALLLPAGVTVALALQVEAPRPWWPNGHGEPVVHRLVTTVTTSDGAPLDTHARPLGFRSIRLVANEGTPPGARGYTFEVNGRRVYATGWNWVPVDVFHGVPRRALEAHLLRLAADAHVVLLRVWGGGLIESESFYDACDRLGIMVWQELSQSSSGLESVPSADPAFVELMAAESRSIAPRLAAHPSLAAWCGGNELADEAGPLDERSPVLAAMRDALAEVDPGRAWLPTSPTGPRFLNRLEDIAEDADGLHDVHGPWEHQGLDRQNILYDAGTSLLNSEFGVEGMANRRQLEALVRPAHRWPADRSNPVYRHLGEWWNNAPLVQASFGGRLADVDRLRRASQHLQADGLRYAVEANRRREPRQSGSLPWQLNESFPNAWCTSAIDHRGDPKPAYFGVRRAYRPVHACARFDRWALGGRAMTAELWAWSAHEGTPGGRLEARVRAVDGRVLSDGGGPASLTPGRPIALGSIEVPPGEPIVVLDLTLLDGDGRLRARNGYVLAGGDDLGALLDLEPATLEVARMALPGIDTWELRLLHTGGPAALGIVVEDDRPIEALGWAEVSDGWFDLLPGETTTLAVRWADSPVAGRRLRVHGWNVDVVVD